MSVPTSQTYGKEKSPFRVDSFRIEITRTIGIWPCKVFLQWIIRKPTQATGYSFNIFRSHSPEGPWVLLTATPVIDTYYYIDDTFPSSEDSSTITQYSMRREPYYKVVVTHLTDGTTETLVKLEAAADRRRRGIINKLRRDAHVALRNGNGTEVAVLKRKWFGEPCTCRSSAGPTTRSHCSTCHGTGIVAGYWNPVYGFASRSAAPVEVRTDVEGKTERHVLRAITEYIPEIIPQDVLVFLRDNKRYMVLEVTPTEIQTVNVHQELVLSELSRASVEYNVTADKWNEPPWF
jgi:hypothetical protein